MIETKDASPSPDRRKASRRLWKPILFCAIGILTLSIIVLAAWMFRLNQNIKDRFAQKRFAPPVEFYSAPEWVYAGSTYPTGYFADLLARKNFSKREFGRPLQAGDYSVWTGEECRGFLKNTLAPSATPDPSLEEAMLAMPTEAFDEISSCVVFRNRALSLSEPEPTPPQIISLSANGQVLGTYDGETLQVTTHAQLEPELFAQYYGENPVLRQVVTIGETPTLCLNSLLAIEDSQFLEHPGVSVTGLARALITNLRAGKKKQGGSTITQQLVKNYFLTDERTLRRKFTEIAMAFLVEHHASKDEILETYINLIYMGQNGPFQVRGYAAASEHYFGKPLLDLGLEECALLSGVLNGPGVYDPFRHPERALQRRAKVLDRMVELKMISSEEAQQAKATALPQRPERRLTEPAPYFVHAVRRELNRLGVDPSEGLRVFTTLDLKAQESAHKAVRSGLERLESSYQRLRKLKESGKHLEAVFVASDPRTGHIKALVGGRGYLATQFNRAIDSRRQVGSIMKPFVYLTALEALTESGQPYTPLTPLKDEATTHKFEGQTWTPHNYDNTYAGEVPLYWALKESLNAATVNLGMSVGLSNIIDTARRMGVKSKIAPLPSLTLGAFELSPLEVLEAYGTIARLGSHAPLSFIDHVESLSGENLYRFTSQPEQVIAAETAAELVGLMKQTLISGTGRGARSAGFLRPAAGKTGTTNDKKDAWFAGFTPSQTAVVWVGYDDNTSHGLTGSSGAVPIWTDFMLATSAAYPAQDFAWPSGNEVVTLTPEQLLGFGTPEKSDATSQPVELVFKRGQAPKP